MIDLSSLLYAALGLLFLGTVIVVVFVTVKKSWQRHRLKGRPRQRVLEKWAQAMGQTDPHRRLLEADAVLDLALRELGYEGTLADKLRKSGAFIPALQDVWNAHKLRNRIAHEAGLRVQPRELDAAVSALEKAVRHLCR